MVKRTKKDRPEAATPRRPSPRLAPRTLRLLIISRSWQNASPNFGQGRGCPPLMSWEFTLAVIGTGWLISQLFRLIDWIER